MSNNITNKSICTGNKGQCWTVNQGHREPQWGLGNYSHGALSQSHYKWNIQPSFVSWRTGDCSLEVASCMADL